MRKGCWLWASRVDSHPTCKCGLPWSWQNTSLPSQTGQQRCPLPPPPPPAVVLTETAPDIRKEVDVDQEGKPQSDADEYKALVRDIFEQHNKRKVRSLDSLFVKFQGKEKQLYMTVSHKYNVKPKLPEKQSPEGDSLKDEDSDSTSLSRRSFKRPVERKRKRSKSMDSEKSSDTRECSKKAAPSSGAVPDRDEPGKPKTLEELKSGLKDIRITSLSRQLETAQAEIRRMKKQQRTKKTDKKRSHANYDEYSYDSDTSSK